MKANKLMIGDWVKFPDGEGQIIILALDGLYLEDKEGRCYACSYDKIQPIPLTPEILEKNGWKNSAPYVWQKEYKGFVFYWEKLSGRFGMDDFRHHQEQWKMHLRIKHIHELQHGLRLYGIKKEIML